MPDIAGVENRGVEIRIVANDRGQNHLDIGLRDQMARSSLLLGGGRILTQDGMNTPAQSAPRSRTQGHQRIQRLGGAGLRREPHALAPLYRASLRFLHSGEVKNAIADRDPRFRLGAGLAPPKNPEGQILNGEIRVRLVGGLHPTLDLGSWVSSRMGFIGDCSQSAQSP